MPVDYLSAVYEVGKCIKSMCDSTMSIDSADSGEASASVPGKVTQLPADSHSFDNAVDSVA